MHASLLQINGKTETTLKKNNIKQNKIQQKKAIQHVTEREKKSINKTKSLNKIVSLT
jgi:hypothetical protein